MSGPFLRDDTTSVDNWEEKVKLLRHNDGSPRKLSELGNLLRLHPDHVEESVAVLREALNLATFSGEPRLLALVRIRFAIALQYAGDHERALKHFETADQLVRKARIPRMRDFVEQHRGKCLVELGRYDEARAAFRTALRLRTRRRSPDPDLVASTQRALDAVPSPT